MRVDNASQVSLDRNLDDLANPKVHRLRVVDRAALWPSLGDMGPSKPKLGSRLLLRVPPRWSTNNLGASSTGPHFRFGQLEMGYLTSDSMLKDAMPKSAASSKTMFGRARITSCSRAALRSPHFGMKEFKTLRTSVSRPQAQFRDRQRWRIIF